MDARVAARRRVWRLPAANFGLVTFEAKGSNDIHVVFAAEDSRIDGDTHSSLYDERRQEYDENAVPYEILIGGFCNKKTTVRVRGRDAVVRLARDDPEAVISTRDFAPYWAQVTGPVITVGKGAPGTRVIARFEDDVAHQSTVNFVTLKQWDTPVVFRSVHVRSPLAGGPAMRPLLGNYALSTGELLPRFAELRRHGLFLDVDVYEVDSRMLVSEHVALPRSAVIASAHSAFLAGSCAVLASMFSLLEACSDDLASRASCVDGSAVEGPFPTLSSQRASRGKHDHNSDPGGAAIGGVLTLTPEDLRRNNAFNETTAGQEDTPSAASNDPSASGESLAVTIAAGHLASTVSWLQRCGVDVTVQSRGQTLGELTCRVRSGSHTWLVFGESASICARSEHSPSTQLRLLSERVGRLCPNRCYALISPLHASLVSGLYGEDSQYSGVAEDLRRGCRDGLPFLVATCPELFQGSGPGEWCARNVGADAMLSAHAVSAADDEIGTTELPAASSAESNSDSSDDAGAILALAELENYVARETRSRWTPAPSQTASAHRAQSGSLQRAAATTEASADDSSPCDPSTSHGLNRKTSSSDSDDSGDESDDSDVDSREKGYAHVRAALSSAADAMDGRRSSSATPVTISCEDEAECTDAVSHSNVDRSHEVQDSRGASGTLNQRPEARRRSGSGGRPRRASSGGGKGRARVRLRSGSGLRTHALQEVEAGGDMRRKDARRDADAVMDDLVGTTDPLAHPALPRMRARTALSSGSSAHAGASASQTETDSQSDESGASAEDASASAPASVRGDSSADDSAGDLDDDMERGDGRGVREAAVRRGAERDAPAGSTNARGSDGAESCSDGDPSSTTTSQSQSDEESDSEPSMASAAGGAADVEEAVRIANVHRVVLAAYCEPFRAMFLCGMREAAERAATVGTPSATRALLRYLYAGNSYDQQAGAHDAALTAFYAAELAGMYALPVAQAFFASMCAAQMDAEAACAVLAAPPRALPDALRNAAIRFGEDHFPVLAACAGFSRIRASALTQLVASPFLAAPSEDAVAAAVLRWQARSGRRARRAMRSLRWHRLSPRALALLERSGVGARRAAAARALAKRGGGVPLQWPSRGGAAVARAAAPPRLSSSARGPPPTWARRGILADRVPRYVAQFRPQGGRGSGVLQWCGRQCRGDDFPFENPHTSGQVVVRASSIGRYTDPLSVVDVHARRFNYATGSPPWWSVELMCGYALVCTHVRIRCDASGDFPNAIAIEGAAGISVPWNAEESTVPISDSVTVEKAASCSTERRDGVAGSVAEPWVRLAERTGAPLVRHPLEYAVVAATMPAASRPYRCFRIVALGRGRQSLPLTNIEMYGNVVAVPQRSEPAAR